MKILFLNYEYPPLGGGAGNATEYLMREFAKDETIEVDLIVSSVDGKYTEEQLDKRIRLYRVPIGDKRQSLKSQSSKELILYAWHAWRLSKKLILEKKYDGVHTFFTVPCGAVAWWLSKQFHLPYIVSLRGSDVPGYSKKYEKLYFFIKPLVRLIWKNAVSVVSNSQGLKTLAIKTNANQEIGVIYNGVDTEMFIPKFLDRGQVHSDVPDPFPERGQVPVRYQTPDPEKSFEKKDYHFTILCASRLENRKGFRYVVLAVAELVKKYSNVHLIIAGGDGNAGEELRTLVIEKNLTEKVIFFGQYTREDLVSLQQRADVFVLPSFNEGMSNSLLEAMAGGLPVLMTPTGGAEELIIDGENGYIIPFGKSGAIAEKLEKLLNDPALTKKMGRKSRSIAESMSWSAVAKEYRELYAVCFEKK